MGDFDHQSVFSVSATNLWDWHARPGAIRRLLPPWQRVSIESPAEIREGSRVRLRLAKGPLSFQWVAEHRDVDPGRGFTDVQVDGPFRYWVHRHEFLPSGNGSSVLGDRIEYELPAGRLGALLAGGAVDRDLRRAFAYRQRVLADDLTRHAAHSDRPRLRVAVTGASGLLGSALTDLLTTGGHQAIALSRSPERGVEWSPESGVADLGALEGADAVVHLAGENIGTQRWTDARKRHIRDSRVEGTRNLIASLADLEQPPSTFICASAVGCYGDRGDEPVTESSAAGDGFLADVCREWESEAARAEDLGMRVVTARFGVVLSPRGGVLARMLPSFRLAAGGRLGSGRQVMSWVGLDDAVAALHHLLMEGSLTGPFNITAPRPETNAEVTRILGDVLGRPTFAAVPAPVVRSAFGEMGSELLLSGARALPERLESAGFVFRYPTLEAALSHALGRT